MMQFTRLGVAAIALLTVAVASLPAQRAAAREYKVGDIAIVDPWSRATPGGAKVGAGYLTITNSGRTPDRLVSAATEIAERAEIHEMSMEGGMMKMREVPDGVAIPAGGNVALAPKGSHLMFLGLKKPLKEGETFSATLNFEKAGSVPVRFVVKGIGATAATMGEVHHH